MRILVDSGSGAVSDGEESRGEPIGEDSGGEEHVERPGGKAPVSLSQSMATT